MFLSWECIINFFKTYQAFSLLKLIEWALSRLPVQIAGQYLFFGYLLYKKEKKRQGNFVECWLWRWGSVRMKDCKAHVLTKTYIKTPFQLWPKCVIFSPRSTISATEQYFLKGLFKRARMDFWWNKWIDLGLNKRRAWLFFFIFLDVPQNLQIHW